MSIERKFAGVFQFFYHYKGEELPVRDFLNTQGHGRKSEPHYENLTENWCSSCMPNRIKSANKHLVSFLFLVTTYRKAEHPRDGKRLVVGFLHRAKSPSWMRLNKGLRSHAKCFDPTHPEDCDFFAGDSESHFVSADNAFELDGLKNPRWKYFADAGETKRILTHLRRSPNILPELRRKVLSQKAGATKQRCEPSSKKRYGTC